MASELNSISQQIDSLGSEMATLLTNLNDDFKELSMQIANLSNEVAESTLTSTYDSIENPCGAQLTTWQQQYAALTSQAAEPTASILTIQKLSANLTTSLTQGTTAQECLNMLPGLLIPASDSGVKSYFYTYGSVLTNSLHPILNTNGSSLIANAFGHYYDLIVTAEAMAIAGAQATVLSNPLVGTFIGVQQSYQASSDAIQPQALPTNTAVQVSGFWSETADLLSGTGYNGQLMWATSFLSGIVPSVPTQQSILGAALTGSISGSNGLTLGTWFIVADNDIDALFPFLQQTETMMTPLQSLQGLLGLDAIYAEQITNYGVWDNTQACANLPSGVPGAFPLTAMTCMSGSAGTATYMAARPVTTSESYLPLQ